MEYSQDYFLNFDHNDNEIIELEDSGKGLGVEIDVSNAKTLPKKRN